MFLRDTRSAYGIEIWDFEYENIKIWNMQWRHEI